MSEYKNGQKVQAIWGKTWYPGIISKVPSNPIKGKFRVQFPDNTWEDFTKNKLRSISNALSPTKNNNSSKKQIKKRGPSDYEKARLTRIAENKRTMAALSLTSSRLSQHAPKRKSSVNKPKRQRIIRKPTEPRIGMRQSKRVRGVPSNKEENPQDREKMLKKRKLEKDQLEQRVYEDIFKKWSRDSQSNSSSCSSSSSSSSSSKVKPAVNELPRLFLVPTGVQGVNDHTLSTKVCDNHYLWGFCVGLYSRIFEHVVPGDIFLFTSSGTGKFNKVVQVTSKRVVPAAVADQYWSRMEYQMGGPRRTNIGFPLLVLFEHQPKEIDWSKDEVLALCGYSDRLMSSRRIVNENGGGKNILIHKCLQEINKKG